MCGAIVARALNFAFEAHRGQRRKYTNEPYITHPVAVAELVREVGGTDEMIAAALLHDVVEDTPVGIGDIFRLFGGEVGRMVEDLTDVSKPEDGNRKVRKAIDCEHTAHALPASKTIKLADLIDNTESIVKHDPNFAKVYLQEKAELLKVLTEGDAVLYARAARAASQITEGVEL